MPRDRIRYAVVGLGHIAQTAVLPAFGNARRNSELVAIVSGDQEKRRQLGKQWDVPAYSYGELDALLATGDVDAVYIALPNTMHRDATVLAARHGVHVLCEKPMAMTEAECEEMIRATDSANVKLMIAYRLHFEAANLDALDLVRKGTLGDLRLFTAVFSFQVREGNIRTRPELGGGPLFDIGIYCVNAARTIFGAEPLEVAAFGVGGREPRFEGVEEAVGALLRFPDERIATLSASFGAADVASYRVVGTEGDLHLDPAFHHTGPMRYTVTVEGTSRTKRFRARDQFAPELIYFSECIRQDVAPQPGGFEGLADVRVLRAIESSIGAGRPVMLPPFSPPERPDPRHAMNRPAVKEPETVHVQDPTAEN